MRALKKAILSCMAVGALAAVVATSAFAETATATYENGKVSSGIDFSQFASDQMTVIVISEEADLALAERALEADDLLYIDQNAADTAGLFQNMGVRANYEDGVTVDENGELVKGDGTLKYGTYVVKVGGDNVSDIYVAEFTVGPNGREIQLGECDGLPAAVNVNDALAVLEHAAGIKTLTGDALIAAECDGLPAAINVNDALAILEHAAGIKTLGTVIVND